MKKKDREFLQDLIGTGYFPEELPPFFTTESLSQLTRNIVKHEESFEKEPKHSKAIYLSIPKAKGMRRNLCIPNPHHQFILSKAIVENWEELQDFYKKTNLSLTRPTRREKSNRALEREYPFSEITRQSIIKSTAARYILKTDISRYYSTIYTHSISWALHGKEVAKKKTKDMKLLGNVLDFYIRNTKEQQTLGIPVGPDTSLVVSEILGTSIDTMICERIPKAKGFRYVDDIYLYFRELGEAEKAKYTIASIFSEFELEMNTEKTKILELHNEIEPDWISELRLHTFDNNSEKDIISYFNKVFKFADAFPKDQVIKYAVKRVRRVQINIKCWPIFESFLLNCILRDSISLPTVLDIFTENYGEQSINLDSVEETMNYVIEFNSNYGNSYELLWSMWYLYWFNLRMYEENVKRIAKVDDPLVALMTLFLRECDRLDSKLDTSLWREHMRSDELYSNYWILTYEAYVRKWLPSVSGKNYIENRPYFNILMENGIRFTKDRDSFEIEDSVATPVEVQSDELYENDSSAGDFHDY